VLGAWQHRRDLLSNRQRGTVFPAVQLHERIAAAFERQYAALRHREALLSNHRGGDPPWLRLHLDAEGRETLSQVLRQRPALDH
jgi:hypothetical protein